MKNIFLSLFLCVAIFGCSRGSQVITLEKFSEISIGSSVKELKNVFGKPDRIDKGNVGEEIYIYLERIQSENRLIMFRQYLFIIQNGKVTSKKILYEKEELDDRNAYDLQTSQNEK